MALPVINFSPEQLRDIPMPQQHPNSFLQGMEQGSNIYGNLIANQLKREQQRQAQMQSQAMPEQLQQQAQYQNLMNALKQNELQYAPQMSQSELAHRQASTQSTLANLPLIQERLRASQEASQNPLLGYSGPAGQIGAAEHLRAQGKGDLADMLMKAMQGQMEQKGAQAELAKVRAHGYDWSTMPMAFREQQLAQASGMGISPDEAQKELKQGKTIEQMAQEKGYDTNNMPEPMYPWSQATKTRVQQMKMATAEIKVLGKRITEALGPYSQRISGMSPLQMRDAIQNKNPDQQAKFLAAAALFPEQTLIRLRLGGAQGGIEAIRHMTDSSMGHIKFANALVTPEIFQKANEYVDDWLTETANAGIKGISKPGVGKESEQKISMPKFRSKEEFQQWYQVQPPEAQAAIRSQLK